jgi:hypothetical protein
MYRTLAICLSRPTWILFISCVAVAAALLPSSAEAQQFEGKALEGARDCYTFLTDSVPTGPRVAASRQVLQISYGAGDVIYIEGNGAGDLTIGDQMQVVRISGPIRHPQTDATIGNALSMLGTIEIIDVLGDRSLALITTSCRETERGDYLVPMDALDIAEVGDLPTFDPNRLVEPSDSDATVVLGPLESVLKDAEKMTRGGITPLAAIGSGEIIIIDQGNDSGWSAGDYGLIYWTEGASQYNLGGMAAPPMIASRGFVIWANENTASVLITDGDGAVELGMRVRRMDDPENY